MFYGFGIVHIHGLQHEREMILCGLEGGRISGNHDREFQSRLQENDDMGLASKVPGASKGDTSDIALRGYDFHSIRFQKKHCAHLKENICRLFVM